MFASRVLSGGGRRYLYPKHVYSPSGGWWNDNPPNAKRNFVIIMGVFFATCFTIATTTKDKEIRYPKNPQALQQ